MSDAATVSALPPSAAAPSPAATAGRSAWRNPSGFGFRDILDIVNPLQHLPVITSIYRWVTGDRPGEAAEIAGDALYGGPIGVAFGLVGALTEDSTGHDLGERVLAKVFGSGDHDSKVAAAPAAAPSPATPTLTPASAAAGTANRTQVRAGPPLAPVPAAVADHPPMPLYGRTGRAAPVSAVVSPAAPGSTGAPNAARVLINHNAALERQIGAGVRAGPPLVPVPLVLPAGTLLSGGAGLSRPTAVPGVPAPPAPGTPVDISQKMLDGLDKYRRLEERQQKAAPTPGIDLAL